MTNAVIKSVLKAIKANDRARIKAIAQATRTTPGKLLSSVKKLKKKKK